MIFCGDCRAQPHKSDASARRPHLAQPARPPAWISPRGFTLIELLAAMAVVMLLMLTVAQMMNSTSTVTTTSGKRVNADAEARTVFDRMAGDFSHMLKRADVDYDIAKGTGNDAMYFYSAAPSVASSNATVQDPQSPVSLVGYRMNAGMQLERVGKGLTWSQVVFLTYSTQPPTNATSPAAASTIPSAFSADIAAGSTTASVIGENVFRVEFTFLLKPCKQADGTSLPAVYSNDPWDTRAGHTSLNAIGLADVQAIVVTMAILDSTSKKILPSGTSLSGAASALPDNTDLTKLPAQVWQEAINSGTFAPAGIPASVARQARIYQRIFPLNMP